MTTYLVYGFYAPVPQRRVYFKINQLYGLGYLKQVERIKIGLLLKVTQGIESGLGQGHVFGFIHQLGEG